MSLKSQVQLETTAAIREVQAGVAAMVNSSKNLELKQIEADLRGGLVQHSDKTLVAQLESCHVRQVVAAVIALGYDKMSSLQSIAAAVETDNKQLALEVAAGVCMVAPYLRLIDIEGNKFAVSNYRHDGISLAVHKATHPLPSLVNLKPLVDIKSNAYRSDSGYKVMLGGKHMQSDNDLPMWALNYLNSIPYSIEVHQHGARTFKPHNPEHSAQTVEKIEANRKLAKQASGEALQSLYENGNKFYFAHNFERRLRIFSKGYQINLQGNEWDKSVLEFHEKRMINAEGKNWLYIATANCFGLDKEKFSTRLEWVETNLDNLEDFIDQADESLLYAKHVRAIRNMQAGKPVGIPVHMDATNSGGQFIGCFLADITSLVATNLVANDKGVRKDMYMEVYRAMQKLCPVKVTRKQVKEAVMPAFFGSSAEPRKVFGPYVKFFWMALEEHFTAIHWYLKALPQLWRDDITEYSFTLPDGYRVTCPITGAKKTVYQVEMLGEPVVFAEEVIGRKRHSTCFLAHMVHAMDAYVVREIVNRCKFEGIPITTIHDSFGAHPNDMGLITQWYREIMADIVREDYLTQMLQEIFGVKVALPVYNKESRNEIADMILQSEYGLC